MKILFLQKRILFPADAGCKIRTLNVLRYVARWHDVTYLCNVQADDTPYLDEMKALGVRLETIPWVEAPRRSWRFYRDLAVNLTSPYPFNVSKDYDPALRARARQLLESDNYDLLICDFVQMARNSFGLDVKAKVLFQHNVEAQIFDRHAQSDSNWFLRQYMSLQYRKMRRFENRAGRQFDTVIAVSPQDRMTFEREYGWKHVTQIDTAVDVDYFRPSGSNEQPDKVLFVGQMDWLANAHGVRHFVQQVWPHIHARWPSARFQVVGRNPGPEVFQLANVQGVEVVGTVPDVRPYLEQATVVVVPLLVGGGTRLKIFEAMAMGKAVVSTTLGAEGLPVRSGEHLLIADSASALTECVSSLLQDPVARNQMGIRAQQLVRERHTAEMVSRQFEQICQDTVELVSQK